MLWRDPSSGVASGSAYRESKRLRIGGSRAASKVLRSYDYLITTADKVLSSYDYRIATADKVLRCYDRPITTATMFRYDQGCVRRHAGLLWL